MSSQLGKSALHTSCLLFFAFFSGLCMAQHTIVLSGTVMDEVGKPVAHAHISARSTQNGQSVEAVTGADGSYSLSGLTAGTYLVTGTASGFATAHTEVTLTGSGKPTLDLILAPAPAQQELLTAPSPNAASANAPPASAAAADAAAREPGLQPATDAGQSRAVDQATVISIVPLPRAE